MPIYEYECEKCGGNTCVKKPVAEIDTEVLCDWCNTPMKRIISNSSFQLRGKGWAKDGYSNCPAPKSCKEPTG